MSGRHGVRKRAPKGGRERRREIDRLRTKESKKKRVKRRRRESKRKTDNEVAIEKRGDIEIQMGKERGR